MVEDQDPARRLIAAPPSLWCGARRGEGDDQVDPAVATDSDLGPRTWSTPPCTPGPRPSPGPARIRPGAVDVEAPGDRPAEGAAGDPPGVLSRAPGGAHGRQVPCSTRRRRSKASVAPAPPAVTSASPARPAQRQRQRPRRPGGPSTQSATNTPAPSSSTTTTRATRRDGRRRRYARAPHATVAPEGRRGLGPAVQPAERAVGTSWSSPSRTTTSGRRTSAGAHGRRRCSCPVPGSPTSHRRRGGTATEVWSAAATGQIPRP